MSALISALNLSLLDQVLIACLLLSPFVLLLAVMVMRRHRRFAAIKGKRKTVDPSKCRRCGYDLRTVMLPRCPECGTLKDCDISLAEAGVTDEELLEAKRSRDALKASREGGPT